MANECKNNNYVKISAKELSELLEYKARLDALECAGVDNWSWYGEAFKDYIEDEEDCIDFDDYLYQNCSEEFVLANYKKVEDSI